jgi:hypothetical protein
MTARNDITGDSIATKSSTEAYRDGWDAIFGKKAKTATVIKVETPAPTVEVEVQNERDALTRQWWAFCEKSQPRSKPFPTFAEWEHAVSAGKSLDEL